MKDGTLFDFTILEDSSRNKYLSCTLCVGSSQPPGNGHIFISSDFDIDEILNPQPRQFRTLKTTIKKHVATRSHLSQHVQAEAESQPVQRHVTRVTEIGEKISSVAYHIISKGRPFSDFF